MRFVKVRRRVHLRPYRGPVAIHQWEKRVRRRRRDHLHPPGVLKAPKRVHQIALVAAPGVPQALKPVGIHLRQAVILRLGTGPLELLAAEDDEIVEIRRVAFLQQIVGQHRDQRRRQRNRAAIGNAVGDQALEGLKQRQIGSGDGFIQPLFLHDRRILRMPDERQVRVKDKREITGRHLGHPRLLRDEGSTPLADPG